MLSFAPWYHIPMTPHLIVEQKITAFVNRYEVYATSTDGEKTELIAFAQQRRLAIKEKVEFFTDEFKTTKLFQFRAEKVMDVHGKYFVEDADDKLIGAFKKQFGASLLNSTWNVLNTDDSVVAVISESNKTLAILRRFVGFIPFIGDIFDLILNFFKYHFVFKNNEGVEIGQYVKTTLLRDHYQLNMKDGAYDATDWRVWAAMAVALDALQSR